MLLVLRLFAWLVGLGVELFFIITWQQVVTYTSADACTIAANINKYPGYDGKDIQCNDGGRVSKKNIVNVKELYAYGWIELTCM